MQGITSTIQAGTKTLDTLTKPFENIALCFSGGGFRAAGFSLGALSYFHELKLGEADEPSKDDLLSKVTYLASASGGTIATMLYSQFSVNGKSFCEYYKYLFEALQEDKLLTEALTILNDSSIWEKRRDKRWNMINAFALAYDRLFDGATINDLKAKNYNTHLEEVCFNTTEFYRGILFRQNVAVKATGSTSKSTFLYGNFVMDLDHEAAGNIKLGDALAASSCFPAGFEPLIFPNDFVYTKEFDEKYFIDHLNITLQTGDRGELEFLFGKKSDEVLNANKKILCDLHDARKARNKILDASDNNGNASNLASDVPVSNNDRKKLNYKTLPQLGFMDGGITDNIGLDSMMKANDRRRKKFDLMMTNDVGTIFMDPYAVPDESKCFIGRLTLGYYIILIALLSGTGVWLLAKKTSIAHLFGVTACGALLTAGGGLFFVFLAFLGWFLKKGSSKESGLNLDKSFGEGTVNTLLIWFLMTPINVLIQMVKARMSSMLILNTDIFLKRVRQLLYEEFFETNKGSHRVTGSRIYDLALSNDLNRRVRAPKMEPTHVMKNVAEVAYTSGTTLWFDKKVADKTHKEACLIACGQFTTCYNLLNYLNNLSGMSFEPLYQKRIATLKTQLEADYTEFQKDPFFLYNRLGKECNISKFEDINAHSIDTPPNFEGLIAKKEKLQAG